MRSEAAVRIFLHHVVGGWRVATLAGAAMFGFQYVVVRVFVALGQGGEAQFLGRQIPAAIRSFLGIDRLPLNSLNGFFAVSWQHPFVLAASLVVPVVLASGWLAGATERRTMAFLLCRPVGRLGLVFSCAVALALWCAFVVLAAVGGSLVGAETAGLTASLNTDALGRTAVSFYLLLLAVSGVSLAFSAMSSDRADSVGWPVTLLLLMYVWNFVALTWAPAARTAAASLFQYYNPTLIFLGTANLERDWLVLGAVAVTGLVLALVAFRTRDLSL